MKKTFMAAAAAATIALTMAAGTFASEIKNTAETGITFEVPEAYLAEAAFQGGKNMEVRSLDFRGQDLPVVDAHDHLEDLAEDFVYNMTEAQAPDGEYIVLAFPDEGVRFDFFKADANCVREVRTVNGEEFEALYVATAREADEDDTPLSVMMDWCEDILEGDDD